MPLHLTRRDAVLAAGLLPLLPRPARAAPGIGTAAEVAGTAVLTHQGTAAPMLAGAMLAEGDTAETGDDGLALLILEADTRLNMGPATSVVLARYLAEVGGTITLGGAAGGTLVFDRPDDRPPIDLKIDTAFGTLGVRGTRFFAGPSRGSFAVFCQRGRVSVTQGGSALTLNPGEGVNLAASGLSPVTAWAAPRIAEAFALAGVAP